MKGSKECCVCMTRRHNLQILQKFADCVSISNKRSFELFMCLDLVDPWGLVTLFKFKQTVPVILFVQFVLMEHC